MSLVNVKSTKRKQFKFDSDDAVRRALIEFFIYLLFLTVTTIVALSSRHIYMYYFNTTVYNMFLSSDLNHIGSKAVPFEQIVTTADCWNFLEHTVLPQLHGLKPESNETDGETEGAAGVNTKKYANSVNKESSGKDALQDDSDEEYKLLRENLLLGPPRLRQIRVNKNSCNVHQAFVRYFDTCYAEYDQDIENKTSDFKGTKYHDASDFNFLFVWAKIGEYHGGGYTADLTYHLVDNEKIIITLKENKWIDRSTRIVIFEFTLYNGNTALFNSVKFFCEIPPTGGAIPFYRIQTVKLYNIWMDSYFVLFAAILLYILTIYYTVEEGRDFLRMGFWNYISSIWNIVDFVIIVIVFLSFVYNIWHPIYLKSILQSISVQPQKYQSLDVICFCNFVYTDMMAILAFIVWIKVFKYISFSKTLLQFSHTFKRCAKDLFGFGIMFIIVFLAYAELGLVLFGTHHPNFRNFQQSFLTMMRMVLGDFEYNAIEEANRVLGPIFFLSFTILVFFILLNMFLAIIAETYSQVKSEIKQSQDQMIPYIKKRMARLCDFLRMFKNRLQKRQKKEEQPTRPQDSGNEETTLPANRDEDVLVADNTKDQVIDIPRDNDIKESTLSPSSLMETEKPQDAPLRVRESEIFTKFFEEIPESENIRRLTQRILLLEDVMEQLITNLDHIIKKIDAKKHNKH